MSLINRVLEFPWRETQTSATCRAVRNHRPYVLTVVRMPTKRHQVFWLVQHQGSVVASGISTSMPEGIARAEHACEQLASSKAVLRLVS